MRSAGTIVAMLLVLLSWAGPSYGADCRRSAVALQVLGSGGPEMQGGRASSSYLIWLQGKPRVLVDSGGGSALRFGQSGATVADLDVILLTHLHVDHAGDLPALIKSSFFEDRRRPLPVFGPVGNPRFPSTKQFVDALFSEKSGAFRYLVDFVDPKSGEYQIEAHDLSLGENELATIFDQGGLRISATPVVHGPVPALAYRVESGGKSIVFSGDTNGDGPNLEKLARGASVFVAHNAVPEGASGVERFLHMPPSVIGRIAGDAKIERLVLSHRMRRTLGKERQTTAEIRKAYRGPLAYSDDLSCFPLAD